MEIPVLLEHVTGDGYRATCVVLHQRLVAEAPTREGALSQVKELIRNELERGDVVQIEVPVPGERNPWLTIAGTWKDHPDIAEVEENIREYRKRINDDPDRP